MYSGEIFYLLNFVSFRLVLHVCVFLHFGFTLLLFLQDQCTLVML